MKALLSWSGGKDSMLALDELRRGESRLELVGLTTTLSAEFRRISSHGVRLQLLEDQARELGLPLLPIFLPAPRRTASGDLDRASPPPNSVYEEHMADAWARARADGVEAIVFGDIFLEDLRKYREDLVRPHGLEAVFPLWRRDTRELFQQFLRRGFRAITVATDPARLGPEWTGRPLDEDFLAAIPEGVDPCGENGEYHSFVFDGPHFRRPVAFARGERVFHAPYHFQELLPESTPAPESPL